MTTVKELMTRDVIAASPSTPVHEIVLLLLKHHISGVPVVNDNKELVGIVTEADLLYRAKASNLQKQLASEGAYCDPKPIIHKYRKMGGKTAGSVMTAHPVILEEHATVAEAVDLMIEKRVNPLPVVRGKKLTGILSRSDLMKFVMQEERELEKHPPSDREIREMVERVLRNGICLPIRHLRVDSRGGKVSLTGEIDSTENLEAVNEIVKSIRGVKEVESDLLVAGLIQ